MSTGVIMSGEQVTADLDDWLPSPSIRVAHRSRSSAPAAELWRAARATRLDDAPVLARLVRWRIPGLAGDLRFDEMFREAPFMVLRESERALICGLVGRIWTLRRDYPKLADADEFREWSARGTARVVIATWVESGGDGRCALRAEARVQAIGAEGQVGVAAVRPLVGAFHHLVGAEALRGAARRAERAPADGG